ncbi:hypothetical protein [Microvirga lenta]|nr:hypothetical protein [Microvirga lenta]MCB5177333.1 hypothetical protein [Microvirga lenta]
MSPPETALLREARPASPRPEIGHSGRSIVRAATAVSAKDSDSELEAQIRQTTYRSLLREKGIRAIRNWRREGDVYRATAEWHGEPVELYVDVHTGDLKQPQRLKSSQVETMLRRQGWARVQEIKRSGDTFSVRAQREDKLYELKIDARSGHIQDQEIVLSQPFRA